MNIRFALANVKSRIEEGPEEANVQARSRQKLGKIVVETSQQKR